MKHYLALAALAAFSPLALAQQSVNLTNVAPVTATAHNTITGKTTATAPKPATKPGNPPSHKPTPHGNGNPHQPSPSPAKPSNSLTSSNSNQNANSNANANSSNSAAVAQNTAKGGSAYSGSAAQGGAAQGGSATGAATSGSSADGTNAVDASNHSVSNENVNVKEIYIPPVVPATPPSTVEVGNVVVQTGECGPLQSVVKIPVDGTFYGLLKKSKTPLGFTEELAPYVDENGQVQEYRRVETDDGYVLYGDQVTQYTAILGVSGARNVAIGGGGGSGSWGQGGVGASSSNQRLVTTLVLRSCEFARVKLQEEPLAPTTIDVAPPLTTRDVENLIAAAIPSSVIPIKHKQLQSHRHRAKHKPSGPCVSVTVH